MRIASVALAGVVLLVAAAAWVIVLDDREAASETEAIEQRRIAGRAGHGVPGADDASGADAGSRVLADATRAPQPLVATAETWAAPAPDAPGRVRVRAVAPDGTSVPGVDITVCAESTLYGRDVDRPGDAFHASRDGTMVGGQRSRDQSRTQRKGLLLADFEDVRPGVPFVVRVADQFGHELRALAAEPLAPAESRLVEVPLEGAVTHLRVRVIDLDGWPIDDAEVDLLGGGPAEARVRTAFGRHGIRTNQDGEVDLGWIASGPFGLEIWRFGKVIRSHSNLTASPGDESVLVRVDRGRRVVIRCADDTGTAVPMSGVFVESIEGGDRIAWEARPVPDIKPYASVWYSEGLPPGELVVNAWAGFHPVRLASALDDMAVTVPALVPVVVTWAAELSAEVCPSSVEAIRVDPTHRGSWDVSQRECEARTTTGSLPPGRYSMMLTGWVRSGLHPVRQELSAAPQTVEVRAGVITEVHFSAR